MEGHPRALDELREILARREGSYAMAERELVTSTLEPASLAAEVERWLEFSGAD